MRMATKRVVLRTGKDSDGDITSLCGSGFSVSKTVAVTHIQGGSYEYWTESPSARVRVKTRNGRPYLTTCADGVKPNNLDNLPDC